MSRARTTATVEHPDPRTDRDLLSAALAPARGSPASSSHSLVISSNLRAALEYEERIRTPLPGSPHHGASIGAGGIVDGGGRQSLPPPPRPKGGPKPKVVHGHVARSSPTGSVSSPASRANDGSGAGANPYINPVPQLSHLMREEPGALIVGDQQGDTQSIGQGSNDSHGTGSSRASPTVSFASPAPSTGVKPESPRHTRGLSSLQKVEKMIGKSKKMLVEGNLKLTGGRRAADASRVGGGELGRRTKAASVLYASSAPSSPISAVSVSLGGTRRMEDGQRGEGKPAAVARRRTEDSHGGRGTVEGDGSAVSESPSLSPHRPISISSTIYSSSAHSFAHPRSPASRPTAMNDYRESFIELASPTFSPTQDDSRSPYSAFASLRDDHPPPPRASIYADDEFSSHPYASTKPLLAPLSTTGKPPIPTSAKPDFSRRSRSAQRPAIEQPSPNTPSPSDSSPDYERALRNRPSTSNLLQPHERADLVRKTRKLTQLFGQTPGVGHYPVDVDLGRAHVSRTNLVGAPPHPSRRKHRPAASMLDDPIVPVYDAHRRVVWPPADDAQYASAGARRRSVPLSPAEFWTVGALSVAGGSRTSSLAITSQDAAHVIEIGSAEGTAQSEDGDSHTDLPDREASPGSPESFIDLSDEEDPAAFPDCRSPATPKGYPLSPLAGPLLSPSTPSIDGLSLSAEQLAEEDRRRKRERLAKLHRFLGSRVPAHLVLGPLDEGLPLPLPASPSPQDDMYGEDADARKLRLRRRRSSSAAEFAGTWSDEIDRLKEDLNDREKAINVRRAVKMEKMFGVAPPQVLYHTRQAVSSPGSSSASPATPKSKHSPQSSAALPPQQSAGPSAGRNPNQAAYKGKSKKGARPGTAESTEPLIDPRAPSSDNWDGGGSGHMLTAMSDVYLHYRHSLNSLNDIIDRDDKQSLAELHDYLSGRGHDTGDETPTEESAFPLSHARAAAQTKAERRRSMPTRTSMASVSSEWTVLPSPPPEENAFQQRRRRAAKLTQFFGVNYRDLMNEILESIEKGLEEERGRGTMQPDEIQDLMQKLRRLKTKRNNWP